MVVMEEVAMMSWRNRVMNPGIESMQQELLDKHFLRKHGPGAYYGQVKEEQHDLHVRNL